MKQACLLCFLVLVYVSRIYSQDCGVKRWDVKTLSDKDTNCINFKLLIKSSVHEQVNKQRPIKSPKERLSGEDTVYSIVCYIVCFKKEKDDKDIHLVLQDPETMETMVGEVISEECQSVQLTSRYRKIKKLNEWFNANIGNPKAKFYYPPTPILVHITGIGFYDFNHGQKGMAANGREIHPILSMELIQEKTRLHKNEKQN